MCRFCEPSKSEETNPGVCLAKRPRNLAWNFMEQFPKWIRKELLLAYRQNGLKSLFEWQMELLSKSELREPEYANLLYSAPTSSGKTLIAELIAVNTVLSAHKKALFIYPYISVAREKFISLQVNLPLDYRIILFMFTYRYTY
ncbi:unnamed protein product [Anisakis simplex]|uniref:DNA polymerase theta (inferred by orthology to a human protein) n=1 Tax=Anisakis simplex TaxID=6269 RepID=A0A0M3J4R0_ANISI|nr:unnamed protein product [Anisakis simplex]